MTAAAPARQREPQPKPPTGTEPVKIRPSDLMREAGSAGGQFHPESPAQWEWEVANLNGPQQALAWVKLASMGLNSVVCVNAAGERVRAEHLAADLGWTIKTAKNVLALLAADGRIRILRGSAIAYRADVPRKRRIEGEGKSRVHGQLLTSMEREILAGRPKEDQERYYADEDLLVNYENQVQSDAIQSARDQIRSVRGDVFEAHGFERKAELAPNANLRTIELKVFVPPPRFSFGNTRVHGLPAYKPESGLYEGEEQGEMRAASLLGFSSSLESTSTVSQSVESRPTFNEATGGIRTLLLAEYGDRFPAELPSPKLCVDVHRALNGAPLNLLTQAIRQSMKRATGMGFARALAATVAERWAIDAPKHAAAQQHAKYREQWERRESEDMAHATLADPTATDQDRELAKEVLKANAAVGGGGGTR